MAMILFRQINLEEDTIMNPKKLRISIITGLLVLIGEIYFLLIRADEQGMFAFAIITIPAIFINTVRYNAEFDRKMHPKSQYEGWFPHFEEGQPDLNVFAFNCWKWILLTVSIVICLTIGTFGKT